jgi:hypothetical protein
MDLPRPVPPGHEDAPPGEKLIVEHRFHPRELSVNWLID